MIKSKLSFVAIIINTFIKCMYFTIFSFILAGHIMMTRRDMLNRIGHIMMTRRDMLNRIKDKLHLAFVDKIQFMKVDKMETNYKYATGGQ